MCVGSLDHLLLFGRLRIPTQDRQSIWPLLRTGRLNDLKPMGIVVQPIKELRGTLVDRALDRARASLAKYISESGLFWTVTDEDSDAAESLPSFTFGSAGMSA